MVVQAIYNLPPAPKGLLGPFQSVMLSGKETPALADRVLGDHLFFGCPTVQALDGNTTRSLTCPKRINRPESCSMSLVASKPFEHGTRQVNIEAAQSA